MINRDHYQEPSRVDETKTPYTLAGLLSEDAPIPDRVLQYSMDLAARHRLELGQERGRGSRFSG